MFTSRSVTTGYGASGGSEQPQDTAENRQAVAAIVRESYVPSVAMMNPGVDAINSGWWDAYSESSTRCNSGDCYYVSYGFQIVDAQGSTHAVKCEWDVDRSQRMATPRNEQANYYWMRRN
jgi:hypothetical protein